ncbi:MAG: gamma-glutamylcyclotransferase [Gemmatimonadota bacterium]
MSGRASHAEPPEYGRVALEGALGTINHARAMAGGRPERVEGLLRGLEEVLATSPGRADRDRDGGRALAELDRLLADAGGQAGTEAIREFLEPIVDRLIDALLGRPDERLVSYGSLRPGEANHHLVADLVGRWHDGEVHGRYFASGGAATRGFPGVVWEPEAEGVPVMVFESPALRTHWPHLDDFEGPGYRRLLVTVTGPHGLEVSNMYGLVDPPSEVSARPTEDAAR